MKKYLYLSEEWHCEAWVNGGEIPIKLASTYLSNERSGILTPDENLIHRSAHPMTSLKDYGYHISEYRDFTIIGSTFNGKKIPNIISGDYYHEDGLILSFCNIYDSKIAQQLRKVACVEILDIDKLNNVISKELMCEAVAGDCQYTKNHERNHFLKSIEDEWQQEYRLFWRIDENKNVTIPPGIARVVPLINSN